MYKSIFLSFIVSLFTLFIKGQETEIGQWREHIPYNVANSLSADGDVIYCASSAGFVAYNSKNGEVKRYSTITGLSDIGVTMLKFNEKTSSLIVAYNNGNIDILEDNGIRNISAIKDDIGGGDKSIFNIRIDGKFAYLSTGFGIVVVDMEKIEIKDTYKLGINSEDLQVNDVCIDHQNEIIYAATIDGVRFADMNLNLSDFNVWQRMKFLPDASGDYNHIDFWAGKLFLNYRTGVFAEDYVYMITDTIVDTFFVASGAGTMDFQVEEDRFIISTLYNVLSYDENLESIIILYIYDEGFGMNPAMSIHHNDLYWIADREVGLVEYSTVGQYNVVAPNGPNTLSINDADVSRGIVWTTSGIMDPDYRGSPNLPFFNRHQNYTWTGLSRSNEAKLSDVYGYIKTKINPTDPSQVYFGSWDNGLLEVRDGKVFQSFTDSNRNETKHTLTARQGTNLIRVGGMDFDDNGNLWATCSETNFALNVKTSEGQWQRFNFGSFVDEQTIVGEVLVAQNGFKWIVLNRSGSNNRIIVFDDKGTPTSTGDDKFIALSTDEGQGSIPGSIVHCIEQDKSGAIWIGTNEGPAVFYSPDFVFQSQQNAQRIFIQQDGQTQVLLENENIKGITSDGANRKWFATGNSGVYLMSEDATKEVNHFFTDNSPIFSDEVNDVAIDNENGEVYFCTSEGLISYKGTATAGGREFDNVQVFPNPVRQDYSGPIAIKGLAENANVKITDLSGILVYETNANGGQAIWDGYTIDGRKVKNGVYLIFCTNSAGESQEVSKVLFLNN